MTLNQAWLSLNRWEQTAGISAAGIGFLSLAAWLCARGLRRNPALRDILLLSALSACLIVPVVAIGVMLTGTPMVSFAIASHSHLQPPAASMATSATSPMTSPGEAVDLLWPPRPESDPLEASTVSQSSQTIRQDSRKVSSHGFKARLPRSSAGGLLAVAWLLGVALFAGFTARSMWRAGRIRCRAAAANTARHRSTAEDVAKMVGLDSTPVIVESAEISSPVVLGCRRPAVLLPPWLCEIVSDDELRHIFIHEFAHIRRRDPWVACAQAAARCLFWPVMTIHWLNRELSRTREEVCDNFVLARHDAIAYGELLLRLAQRATGCRPLGDAIGILNGHGNLENRVVRMLDPRASRATRVPRWVQLLLMSAFILAACLLCGTRFVTAQPPKTPTDQSGEQNDRRVRPAIHRPVTDSIGDPLPENALMRLGTLRFRPGSAVWDLALSPDETTLVTVGDVVVAWDARTGKALWHGKGDEDRFGGKIDGTRYGARGVTFSADSSRFYTTQGPDGVVIWETATGKRDVLKLPTPKQDWSTMALDITPDGTKIALGRRDGVFVRTTEGEVLFDISNTPAGDWQLDNNDRLTFTGHYSCAWFSPDGLIVAAVTSDRPDEVRLYDAESGRELQTFALSAKLVRFAFSADSRQFVTTERDNAVRMYDVAAGDRLWSRVIELNNIYENYTSGVAFSPDGKTIAAGTTDHAIYLLDAATGEEAGKLTGHHSYPWTLAFTRDSRMLYSAGWDGTIRRWDVPNRRQLPPPQGVHASEVIAASPDGATIAWQDDYRTVHLVDIGTGKDLQTIELSGMRFSQLLFAPNGEYLAGAGSGGDKVFTGLWNVKTGKPHRYWHWPKGRDPHSQVEAMSFALDGTRLAAAVSRQSIAYVWDVAEGNQVAALKHIAIGGLSFSPDGKTLATAGWEPTIHLWDTGDWTTHQEFTVPNHDPRRENGDMGMYGVCYSPDGGLLATSHHNSEIRVWDAEIGQLRTKFRVKGGLGYSNLSFSPDGLWLAGGDRSGNVELWEPSTGTRVWGQNQHRSYVYTTGFGSDSRTLLSGSDDGLGYLWEPRPPGDNSQKPDLAGLWNDLAGEDAAKAYQAMWNLTDAGDNAVPLLAEKLRPVMSVIAAERPDPEDVTEETTRKSRLKKMLVDKDPRAEFELTVRRAITVLGQIGTPDAIRLLEELAKRNPEGELARFAAATLKRLNVSAQ